MVANSVSVPKVVAPAGDERVSYLGSVTMSRGCDTMIEVGRELRRRTDGAVKLEVIGEAPDPEARQALQSAAAAGDVSWLGFVRSEEALARVSGSLAGLCLLRNLPNYRVSLSTKIVEYCALGVPVITTPLPLAADLVRFGACRLRGAMGRSERCGRRDSEVASRPGIEGADGC